MVCSQHTFTKWFFFFFQAEDGIRDYKVTGVQTCALPISAQGLVAQAVECLAHRLPGPCRRRRWGRHHGLLAHRFAGAAGRRAAPRHAGQPGRRSARRVRALCACRRSGFRHRRGRPPPGPAALAPPVSELPLTDEATPWASEGMLAPRRGVVALPASLPPLPQDLEPQRPMVTEQAAPEEIPTPAMQPVLSDYQPPSAPSVEMQLAQESRLAEMADVTDAADVAGAADVAAAGDVAPVGEVVPADLVVPVVQAVVAEAAAAPTPAAPTMESIWDNHGQPGTAGYLVHQIGRAHL